MTDHKKLVDDLRDIGKTMFALGTTHISMNNVSISLAYDKGWGQTANDAAAAIEALQAQLPKRGEWVEENRRPRSSQFVCSECHRTAYDPQPTRDKAWRKRCRYAYCPNCGAKMEVQDGK